MIYVTGDTHGMSDFFKLLSPNLSNLSKKDYVIIAGDCGVLFDPDKKEQVINLYSYLPFSILFVDGNHENFDLINSYPVEYWHGGKVHKIADSIYHLMRGQIFEIDGSTFFTFGGALSFDKKRRIEGISWWADELPTNDDFSEAITNLSKYNYKVDFVITHDCPYSWMGGVKGSRKLMYEGFLSSASNEYLENILLKLSFRKWFFGHYHMDTELFPVAIELYQQVLKITDFTNCGYNNGSEYSGDKSLWKKPDRFSGKKVSILGDSVSTFEGTSPEKYYAHYKGHTRDESGVKDLFDMWWMQVIHSIDAVLCKNDSFAGSCVSPLTKHNATLLRRLKNLDGDDKPDIIFIMLGTNDFGRGLHTKSRCNMFTFFAGYRKMVERIKKYYPDAEIYCSGVYATDTMLRQGHDIESYNGCIKEVVETYSLHYVDSVILQKKDTHDGLHPNNVGMTKIARKWIECLLECV